MKLLLMLCRYRYILSHYRLIIYIISCSYTLTVDEKCFLDWNTAIHKELNLEKLLKIERIITHEHNVGM